MSLSATACGMVATPFAKSFVKGVRLIWRAGRPDRVEDSVRCHGAAVIRFVFEPDFRLSIVDALRNEEPIIHIRQV
jgi:hypothetical protein